MGAAYNILWQRSGAHPYFNQSARFAFVFDLDQGLMLLRVYRIRSIDIAEWK
jgi:hypothetical protein